jgi:hypothetical protein
MSTQQDSFDGLPQRSVERINEQLPFGVDVKFDSSYGRVYVRSPQLGGWSNLKSARPTMKDDEIIECVMNAVSANV